jgi:enoyl-CoA hydratase/carnithine racemase
MELTNLDDRVSVEIAEHVAVVSLTRAAKHNSLDRPTFHALNAAQDLLAARADLRAVVLQGEGPSFCSGLDFAAVSSDGLPFGSLLIPHEGSIANFAQRAAFGWVELSVPVIAAVHGACLGGGFQLALAADIRIAEPSARLSVMEVDWGLIPDMGISQTLPRLVGADIAKELLWTGRILDGTEAHQLGLVTRLSDDPVAEAVALAASIASRSPDAVRAGKRLVDSAWNATAADGLALEESLQRSLLGSPNQTAAVAARLGGKQATYTDGRDADR